MPETTELESCHEKNREKLKDCIYFLYRNFYYIEFDIEEECQKCIEAKLSIEKALADIQDDINRLI
jgi:hypothetical protein